MLPADILGKLSEAQLETVIYAGEAHTGFLAGAWTVDDTLDSLSAASEDAERAARYRLVIEEGPSGSFIYKTMDRLTGEVIKQLPREQVVDLMQTGDYSSGSVINTTA